MNVRFRLRFRLYLLVLPLFLAALLSVSVLSFMEARTALVRVTNKHLAFKAEQLRDFFYSEWEILKSMNLENRQEYRQALQESFGSYAASLLRNETEYITVLNNEGNTVLFLSIQENIQTPETYPGILNEGSWYDGPLYGEHRIAVLFTLNPLEWTVIISDSHNSFFSELNTILQSQIWISAISLLGVITLLSIFLGYIARPLEKMTAAIKEIDETNDLSRRIIVENYDEIGILADHFNNMIASLQDKYEKLEIVSGKERSARQTALEREEETLFLLARVSEYRDEETGEHQNRIGEMASLFASLLGMDAAVQDLYYYSAPLHDIGKIRIPDAILLKPGKLDPAEWELMQKHTVYGYELLKDSKSMYLLLGAKIALTHHENWNGTGYPYRKKREDIPLSGRIISIIDVFDALCSDRPYKKVWEPEQARDFIHEECGKKFDPKLCKIFFDNFSLFRDVIKK